MTKIHLYPESSHRLRTCEDIRNYIYGGRGIVTLKAPSGKQHTYAFYKPMNSEGFPDDIRFVYAIHECRQKFYIGMIENEIFRLTRNSRFLPDTEIVKGAKYIMRMSKEELDTPHGALS